LLPGALPVDVAILQGCARKPQQRSIGGKAIMQQNQTFRFREAKRIQQSFLASLEKKTLVWLAARTPASINSDHLTVLGLLAMAGAGLGYWWSSTNRAGLIVVIVCLALNWLGDSLDGTLARVRNCPRPRYGFYVDHIVDAFSAFFLLTGLGLSGYMSPAIALGLLIAYLMLSIEVYLATYTLGDFKISYFKMGPTELRILLCIGNLALLSKSVVHLFGRAYRLFDVGGTIGISGMLLILVISAIRNTIRLYQREPLPAAQTPRKTEPLSSVKFAQTLPR
jgi:archaetidylinositol phosphate synthase